ncbi:MAG: S1/P1 nuclease [Bacteroidota bacterium]|nr:S1/P1 nuclease [Bacteroidota bacterium]
MKTIKLAFLLLLFPLISFAWNAGGHSTAGAIAYTYLKKNNPVILQKVLATLQYHPWYHTRWADTLSKINPDQKDITLFMLASVWPDEVRRIPELGGGEKTKWHYINYPFVPENENITALAPENINAVEKLNALLIELKTQKESKEKAINLCWLFHILQDLHQPLHTIGLFDINHPTGDRGGNDTYIKFVDSTRAWVLHSYWDKLVHVETSGYQTYAQKLLDMRMYKPSKLKELKSNLKVEDWVKNESWNLAVSKAYLKGTIKGTKENPTQVNITYDQEARAIAERRVVLSGIRLARSLIELYL